MFRLLGILTLGNLLFGGHHRHLRRSLRRGLLFGALLGWLANRDFDADRVREDVRHTVRDARRTARKAMNAAREELRNARREEREEYRDARREEREERHERVRERVEEIRAEAEARRAQREVRKTETVEAQTVPAYTGQEAREIEELAADLERNAATAAMASDVPTIDFPDENGKYDSARKYGYA